MRMDYFPADYPKVLPCKKCGSQKIEVYHYPKTQPDAPWLVECSSRDCNQTSQWSKTEKQAVEDWNTLNYQKAQ